MNQGKTEGKVIQVIGPVVDCLFPEDKIPEIYNAVHIGSEGFDVPMKIDVTCETQQHLGEGRVRCIALEPTEGLVRGMKAVDMGKPITIPVGRNTLGRIMNVLGKPVDEQGPLESDIQYPIHRPAPILTDQSGWV